MVNLGMQFSIGSQYALLLGTLKHSSFVPEVPFHFLRWQSSAL